MSTLRVSVPELTEGLITLDRESSHYVLSVRRARPGQRLELFSVAEQRAVAAVLIGQNNGCARCAIEGEVQPAGARRPLCVVQAYGKHDKLDQVVRNVTALGATQLVILLSERVVVRPEPEKAAARRERLVRIALDTARQSGRSDVPELLGPVDFAGLGSLRPLLPRFGLMLEPSAPVGLAQLLEQRVPEGVAVLIGPEGGFTVHERELAEALDFVPVRFGDLVLRTELASAAVLGALLLWTERVSR
jgi:16S rRNA (uracil1498-N3)-methyltransferase